MSHFTIDTVQSLNYTHIPRSSSALSAPPRSIPLHYTTSGEAMFGNKPSLKDGGQSLQQNPSRTHEIVLWGEALRSAGVKTPDTAYQDVQYA